MSWIFALEAQCALLSILPIFEIQIFAFFKGCKEYGLGRESTRQSH